MRGWLLGAVVLAATFAGACSKDEDSKATSLEFGGTTAVESTARREPTSTTTPALGTAAAVADAISAAALGCQDRRPEAPQPAPGFPLPSELVRCTAAGQQVAITMYSKEGEVEAAGVANAVVLCRQLGRAETEKRVSVYGALFIVGTANGDPAIADKIAQATGGMAQPFTCP